MAYETKKVELPSCGYFSYTSEVEIRSMTGADEKVLYSSVSDDIIDKLLRRCIVSPKGLNVEELCEQDKFYLLLQIRILTYGSAYKYEAKCSNCSAPVSILIDLDGLDVIDMDDDIYANFSVVLSNGDEIVYKTTTSKDSAEINRILATRKASRDRGLQMILKEASVISSINGEKKSLLDKQVYLENLSAKLTNELWRNYTKIKFGVDTLATCRCPSCSNLFTSQITLNAEFFRPDYDDFITGI